MQYSIENEILRLTVDTHGAEPVSVLHKPTGAELLWQGDPAVWGRHAPILFPYTGKLTGGKMIAKGVEYAGGQHGFARDVEHAMTRHADNLLEFELHANAETLPKWPYAFVLRSTFTLEGETVHHTLTVENPVLCGVKQFQDGRRYVVLLYRASRFTGVLRSSDEGRVFWTPLAELPQARLADSFQDMLEVFLADSPRELYYGDAGAEILPR